MRDTVKIAKTTSPKKPVKNHCGRNQLRISYNQNYVHYEARDKHSRGTGSVSFME
jgi:hypothetical protein